MSKLKQQFETICQKYIEAFQEKQHLRLDFWIADSIGEIACFGGFYFNLNDIRYDIDTNQPSGKIIEWEDYIMANSHERINYENYCKLKL